MIVGIILAAGKGTRMKSKDRNKVTLLFNNKPLVVYGAELMRQVADRTIVVVGAFYKSVVQALRDFDIIYAYQRKRLGTGHAVRVAVDKIKELSLKPDLVLVGYGDHMMFYTKNDIRKLIEIHKNKNSAISLITTEFENKKLHWGIIIRNKAQEIIDIIEYKDADLKIRDKKQELNAAFYCFSFDFLKTAIYKIRKSKITNEYYINFLFQLASKSKLKISSLKLPFTSVGIGINRWDELIESEKLYHQR